MSTINASVTRFLAAQRAFQTGPLSITGLAKALDCNYESAQRWMSAFHEAGAIEFKGFGAKGHRGMQPSLYQWKRPA